MSPSRIGKKRKQYKYLILLSCIYCFFFDICETIRKWLPPFIWIVSSSDLILCSCFVFFSSLCAGFSSVLPLKLTKLRWWNGHVFTNPLITAGLFQLFWRISSIHSTERDIKKKTQKNEEAVVSRHLPLFSDPILIDRPVRGSSAKVNLSLTPTPTQMCGHPRKKKRAKVLEGNLAVTRRRCCCAVFFFVCYKTKRCLKAPLGISGALGCVMLLETLWAAKYTKNHGAANTQRGASGCSFAFLHFLTHANLQTSCVQTHTHTLQTP